MEIINKFFKYLLFIAIFAAFFIKASVYIDPDFGYRLVNGQKILSEGFGSIRTDNYSYTMEGYAFIEHSWVTAVVWAYLLPAVGYGGIAFVYTFLVFLTLFLLGKAVNEQWTLYKDKVGVFANPVLILAAASFLKYFGIRAQVISWFFVSLLAFLLYNKDYWKRFKFLVPALFLLWANVHGGFFVGIVILLTFIFFDSLNVSTNEILSFIKDRKAVSSLFKIIPSKIKLEISNFVVLILSSLATLVNPYGIELWGKIFSVVGDTSLRWKIAEWMPFFYKADFGSAFAITASLVFVIKYIKKIEPKYLVLYFLLLAQGLVSTRQIPIWVAFATPLTTLLFSGFYKEVKKLPSSRIKYELFYKYFILISASLFLIQFVGVFKSAMNLKEQIFYPKNAVNFLKSKNIDGRVFSTYAWGGYLVWKYSEKKVFVTGQMPSWRWDGASENKLKSAFEVQNEIFDGNIDYEEVFDKFGITTVLLPNDSDEKTEHYSLSKFSIEKKEYSLQKSLEESGWEKIYEDQTSVVFQRS